MKYMGSKNRIAKFILPIILKDRREGQWYVEPFVGGGNIIDKVGGNRIGSDSNKYSIEALRSIRDDINDLPKDNTQFTEVMYKELRFDDSYIFKGYIGFAGSYSGKWLGGWCRDGLGKRDYIAESYRNAVKQSPFLNSVDLLCCKYDELYLPNNSIIYCDPPYAGTTQYKDKFDSDKFWQWCRDKTLEGHQVFVSEYNAPDDFKCLWSKEIVSSLTKNTGSKKGTEKLFKYKG